MAIKIISLYIAGIWDTFENKKPNFEHKIQNMKYTYMYTCVSHTEKAKNSRITVTLVAILNLLVTQRFNNV